MAKVCEKCGRGTQTGNQRSHSNIATLRKFAVNLQKKKVDGKTIKVCSRCLKKMAK